MPVNCSTNYFLRCLFCTCGLLADWHCWSAAVLNTEATPPPSFLENSVKLLLLSFALRQVDPEEAPLCQCCDSVVSVFI